MWGSACRLVRAVVPATATPRGAAVFTSGDSAAGKQAVGELDVYLRSMKAAQRRWAREIVAHETHVRRMMIVEEQIRQRLKQQVLKGTREHLKYLTNTDLMAVAQLVSPPSVDVFLAYGILSEQVSGFTVYVMGCLATDPNRLDVPLPILIADLSSRWFIVPPHKKEAYNELAAIFRSHLTSRSADAVGEAGRESVTTTAVDPGISVRGRRAAEKRTVSSSAGAPVCASAPPPRGGRGCLPKASAAAVKEFSALGVARSARKRLQVRRRVATAAAASTPISWSSSSLQRAAVATPPSTLLACDKGKKGASRATTCGNQRSGRSVISSSPMQSAVTQIRVPSPPPLSAGDRAALTAFTEELQLPADEQHAFCRFAEASLREMERSLGVSPGSSMNRRSSGHSKGKRSTKMPLRGVQLRMNEWLPIAAEEWVLKTRRQKKNYMRV